MRFVHKYFLELEVNFDEQSAFGKKNIYCYFHSSPATFLGSLSNSHTELPESIVINKEKLDWDISMLSIIHIIFVPDRVSLRRFI